MGWECRVGHVTPSWCAKMCDLSAIGVGLINSAHRLLINLDHDYCFLWRNYRLD